MTEELYVFINGNRKKVDIYQPSGIVLLYESTIFNANNNAGCDRSYTFKLPATTNNQIIFDILQDCRRESELFITKFKCEYFIDGCLVVDNGNFYIDSFNGEYSVVMTWNVMSALQKIKDDNFNINEFDQREDVETGHVVPSMTFAQSSQEQFDNFSSCLRPFYGAGVPVIAPRIGNRRSEQTYKPWYYALPVVPVPYILKRIENYYGVEIDLYNHCTFEDKGDITNIIDYGAIPLVKTGVRPDHEKDIWCSQTAPNGFISRDKYIENVKEIDNAPDSEKEYLEFIFKNYFFMFRNFNQQGDVFTQLNGIENKYWEKYQSLFGVKTSNMVNKFRLYGIVTAKFYYKDLDHEEDEEESVRNVLPPKLSVWRNNPKRGRSDGHPIYEKPEEIVSIEGVKIGESDSGDDSIWEYEFNFDPAYGAQEVNIDGQELVGEPFYFSFDRYGWFESGTNSIAEAAYFYEEGDYPHPTDIISNLPDVSCLDFVNSLFYMTGGYPYDKDGKIEYRPYYDIFENVRNAVDWTNKLVYNVNEKYHEIKFEVSEYTRRNWYLTASDDIDKIMNREQRSSFDSPDDVYADGYLLIENEHSLEDSDKTIVKVPWNAPFIKSAENPRMATGNTLKYWYLPYGEKELKANEAKPCYGILYFEKGDNNEINGTYTKRQAYEAILRLFDESSWNITQSQYKVTGRALFNAGWTDVDVSKEYHWYSQVVKLSDVSDRGDSPTKDYYFLYTPISFRGIIMNPSKVEEDFGKYERDVVAFHREIMQSDKQKEKYIIGRYNSLELANYWNDVLQQFGNIIFGDSESGEVNVDPLPGEPRGQGAGIPPYLSMKAWEGFSNTKFGASLKEMLENPFVITVKLNLPIYELVNLNMAVPVYLEQYNSYFCIVKIQRETDGICTAELARIPVDLLK